MQLLLRAIDETDTVGRTPRWEGEEDQSEVHPGLRHDARLQEAIESPWALLGEGAKPGVVRHRYCPGDHVGNTISSLKLGILQLVNYRFHDWPTNGQRDKPPEDIHDRISDMMPTIPKLPIMLALSRVYIVDPLPYGRSQSTVCISIHPFLIHVLKSCLSLLNGYCPLVLLSQHQPCHVCADLQGCELGSKRRHRRKLRHQPQSFLESTTNPLTTPPPSQSGTHCSNGATRQRRAQAHALNQIPSNFHAQS